MKQFKRWLYLTHRWLGVVLCVWFALLFASGIIMMYVEYPELTEEERLWQLAPLDTTAVHLSLTAVAKQVELDEFSSIKLTTVNQRTAYQLADTAGFTQTVFADNGAVFTGWQPAQAVATALQSGFANAADNAIHTGVIHIDQWTVSSALDSSRPLHRVALADDAGTVLYISDLSGQIVRDTNRNERFWNWLGSTIHWIYPWQLRQHATLWNNLLTYLALAGVFSVVSGTVVGWWRLRLQRRYKSGNLSPFTGWQKWHHVLGLCFVLFIATWIFSGLMSMFPWGIFDNSSSAEEQMQLYYGGPLDKLSEFPTLPALSASDGVKEIEWRRLGNKRYLVLHRTASDASVLLTDTNAKDALLPLIAERLPALRPEAQLLQQRTITEYDNWYYTHHNRYRPLPVVEARFNDDEVSWYHIDLRTGAVVQRLTHTDRWARWLYNGLHSFDFALLFQRRPLWDLVLIVLCICGFLFSLTAVVIGWRRLRH